MQLIYPDSRSTNANGTRIKRSNNIYYVNGGFSHTFPAGQGTSFNNVSRLGDGASLNSGEVLYTGSQQIFKNTTSPNPENWDFTLVPGSYGIGNGSSIGGINKDFVGVTLTNTMDIGLYKYSAKPNVILVSSTNVTCKTAANGSFTILLPASPSNNSRIAIADVAGTFNIRPLIINNNGNKLMGANNILYLDMLNAAISLVYVNSTYGWRII
jgi:hypothetical protein